jgi:hypothetical protein
MRYLFVGERPSPLAARRGWQWTDGRVCARTLYRALAAVGISPADVGFVNLWTDPGLGRPTDTPNLDAVRSRVSEDVLVIALGRLVERTLRQAGIPHRFMVHPAARGAIRKQERYIAHVRAVLARGAERRDMDLLNI